MTTPLPSSLRASSSHHSSSVHPSSSSSSSSTSQASALQARIAAKRLELESLQQLRLLSAGLAQQMQALEEKLSILSSGTEAVAAVVQNWGSVLRAVGMAAAALPKPKEGLPEGVEAEVPLPQTLVRIPIQQAEAAQRGQEAVGAYEEQAAAGTTERG